MAERKTHWSGFDKSGLTSKQRDELIVKLRKQGLSMKAVGEQVGMSANGVMHSLRRIEEGRPGRDPRA